MKPFIESGKYPVWFNDGVVSQTGLDDLKSHKVEVSYFNYVVDIGDEESREEALFTIAEHHPNERIWSESRPKL